MRYDKNPLTILYQLPEQKTDPLTAEMQFDHEVDSSRATGETNIKRGQEHPTEMRKNK